MTIEKYYKTHDISEFINELESIDLLCCDELNGKLIDNAVECDTLSAPIKTFLTITEKCNLQCKHCFGSFGKGEELSIKNIEEILETLLYIGIFQISITGGEPLLHKDIINILKSDGSVVPCIFFDMALDNKINVKSNNILKDNFSDIWNNEYFRYVRKIGINQKCRKCYSFLKDTCNGGCPVNSKYYSGKFDGKDVFCNI